MRDHGSRPKSRAETLEEPPPRRAALVTPSRLLETIRSRIQPLPFRLVARPEIEVALVKRFGAAAARFAAVAAGKPGIAITLASTESARDARTALEREFYTLVGSRLTERFAWAADMADLYPKDPQKRNEEIEMRLVQWGELLRDAAVTAVGAPERATRPEQTERTQRLRHRSQPATSSTSPGFERCRRDVVETTVSARMLLELLSLKLRIVPRW